MNKLGHINAEGKISMNDITDNNLKLREAEASGFIHLKAGTVRLIKENEMQKGEVLTVAELAGIQAAKKTGDLIPLTHPNQLTKIDVKAYVYPNGIEVKSYTRSLGKIGVEMEALTAVCAALLSVYEMCKDVEGSMVLSDIKTLKKSPD